MAIYSGFSHSKWHFSIVMLVYQRVNPKSLRSGIPQAVNSYGMALLCSPTIRLTISYHAKRTNCTNHAILTYTYIYTYIYIYIHIYIYIYIYIYTYIHTYIYIYLYIYIIYFYAIPYQTIPKKRRSWTTSTCPVRRAVSKVVWWDVC